MGYGWRKEVRVHRLKFRRRAPLCDRVLWPVSMACLLLGFLGCIRFTDCPHRIMAAVDVAAFLLGVYMFPLVYWRIDTSEDSLEILVYERTLSDAERRKRQ